ncbi:MAG: 1-(5-phosphoribosyl)-5-[Thermoguttaceae bacterium]|nr:1-(5-phosphoribosyl)-5-[(5-phosphoribosylamino)methylideneamino]imidazole-4-carboxamide isomerase [Thermoguttaceae bacterium]
MQIWPAIDIRAGKCVRLCQGDYGRETIYGDSPADMAQHWVSLGARRLHLVDLDGAKSGSSDNFEAVAEITRRVSIPCELGGGIRSEETIRRLLEAGVHRLVIGTLALKRPQWFREMAMKFPNRLVLGIDARGGMVATDGWLETSATPAVELARQFDDLPLAALVYTDIATDGMMKATSIPIVASGGVTKIDDVRRLAADGLPACIIGRALYEKTIELADALVYDDEN